MADLTDADPYADEWHQGSDCTYRCPNTGNEILAFREDRYMVVLEDESGAAVREARAKNETLRAALEPFTRVERIDGVAYCPGCRMFAAEWGCGCPHGRARAAWRGDDG